MSLSAPSKHLRYSEADFTGYWVQLNALIRHNDHADKVLDQLLVNPLNTLLTLDEDSELEEALVACYAANNFGFPPSKQLLREDPITAIKEFKISTMTLSGQNDAFDAWIALHEEQLDNYRSGIKYIYEKAVATLSSSESSLFVTDVAYGSGLILLEVLQHQQQRQTNMGLHTLFVTLITIQLRPKECIQSLFSRVKIVRSRLKGWNPPIVLPDQLVLVCILRLLPREFSSTRTIIMSKREVDLTTAYDMLLDAENADANLIARTIGSGKSSVSNGLAATSVSTSSLTKGKKTRRKREPAKKSAKCIADGPCHFHGERCSHAASECLVLHPELKTAKTMVACATIAPVLSASTPEDLGMTNPFLFVENSTTVSSGYSFTTETSFALATNSEHADLGDKFDFMTGEASESTSTTSSTNIPAIPELGVPSMSVDYDSSAASVVVAPKTVDPPEGMVQIDVLVYEGDLPGPVPVRLFKPFLMSSTALCEDIYNRVIELAQEDDGQLGQALFEIYLKNDGILHHVKCLETPATMGFNKHQMLMLWTHENVRARKGYGHPLYGLIDPDANPGTAPGATHPRDQTSGCADSILVAFHMALVEGIPRIYHIENAESGWSVRAGPDPKPEHILRGFQLTQAQFLDYHRLMTGQEDPLDPTTTPNVQAQEASAMLSATVPVFVHEKPKTHDRRIKGAFRVPRKRRRTFTSHMQMSSQGLRHRGPRSIRVYDLFQQQPVQSVSRKQPLSTTLAYLQRTAHVRSKKPRCIQEQRTWPTHKLVGFQSDTSDSDADEEPEPDYEDHETDGPFAHANDNAHAALAWLEELGISRSQSNSRVDSRKKTDFESTAWADLQTSTQTHQGDLDAPPPLVSSMELDVSAETPPYSSGSEHNGVPDLLTASESESSTSSESEFEVDPPLPPDSDSSSEDDPSYLLFGTSSDNHGSSSPPHNQPASDDQSNDQNEQDDCSALVQVGVSSALSSLSANNRPVIDSGATAHLCSDRRMFSALSSVSAISGVRDITGHVTPVTGSGTIGKLRGVLLVDGAAHCLVSVGAYLDQHGGSLQFTTDDVSHVVGSHSTPLGRRCEDGLYRSKPLKPAIRSPAAQAYLSTDAVAFQLLRERIHRLHRCFGHCGRAKLSIILEQNKFKGLSRKHAQLLTSCLSCQMGNSKKQRKPRITHSGSVATSFAERLLTDCSGRTRTSSLSGARYAVVTVCEATGWVFGNTTSQLSHVHDLLKDIIEVELHQRGDHAVKFLRSDSGTEFLNSRMDSLLRLHDIKRERTCRGTSFQNGKAERTIGVLFAKIRTLLFDAKLPTVFWAEAFACAVYMHNRTPGSTGVSPFQSRHKCRPKISHLRPFGTGCCINIPTQQRKGKLVSAAVPGIMLGYGYVDGKKGYRVYVPTTRKVITSYDVTFNTLAASLHERRSAEPHLVASTAQTAQMLEELQDPTLHQTQQDYLAAPTTMITPASTLGLGDRGVTQNQNIRVENSNRPAPADHRLVAHNHRVDPQLGDVTTPQHVDEDEDESETLKPGPGYVFLPDDDPFFNAPGIHAVAAEGPPGPITGRTRSARHAARQPATLAHAELGVSSSPAKKMLISDCAPAFVAYAAFAACDLATDHVVPKNYKQAMSSPDRLHWIAAMKEELTSVKDAGTYVLIAKCSVPNGTKIIGHTWVYRIKNNEDGTIARFKARICIDGSKQVLGIDYDKTFAPVAHATTIRLVIALAASQSMNLRQFDVKVAFLASKIDRPVFMHVPQGAYGGPYKVWELKKSLYGLKQAPRLFNAHLDKNLKLLGFLQSSFDPCLYFRITQTSTSYLAVVVDDLLLATNKASYASTFEHGLGQAYSLKSLGIPKYMVGMQLDYPIGKITVCQTRYIQDVAKRFNMKDTPRVTTPACPSLKLTKIGERTNESPRVDSTKYRSLVGALMYAVMTRPDISAPVSICARFLSEPRLVHRTAALRILSYLLHTPDVKLIYRKDSTSPTLVAYVDASWADDKDTRRSRFGYAVYLADNIIEWKSKLHPCIVLSTAESEYVAATEVCKTIVWLRNTLNELQVPQVEPTTIYEDNQACIHMATNKMITGRNKHMELKQHYVRSLVQSKAVKLQFIGTKQQRADIFTKNLGSIDFARTRGLLLETSGHNQHD